MKTGKVTRAGTALHVYLSPKDGFKEGEEVVVINKADLDAMTKEAIIVKKEAFDNLCAMLNTAKQTFGDVSAIWPNQIPEKKP